MRLQASALQRIGHAAEGAIAIGGRCCHVIGIARHAIADDFGIDLGAARLGMLELLEHDDAGTFAHHEAVAVLVIGARGLLGIIVELGGQRLARDEAADADAADRRFGTARHHDVGIIERDEARRVADGMRAGRTGGDHSVVGTLEAELDRHEARGQVDQRAGNEERADAARALLVHQRGGVGNVAQATDAGAHENAGAVLLVLGLQLDAGILHRLLGGRHGIDDEVVVAADFLGIHPLLGIEGAVAAVAARDFAGDLAGQVGCIEARDLAAARLAREKPAPGFVDAIGERGNHTKSGDDDTPHAMPFLCENAAAGSSLSLPPRGKSV